MRNINRVVLVGNVTREPELRQTGSGQSVATFTIATNRMWVTREGKKESAAEYHDVVAWARLAELCKDHIKKGKLVYIEGYLKTRSWDTTEGIKKFKTEVIIDDLIMLDKRQPAGEAEGALKSTQREHGGMAINEEITTNSLLSLEI